MQARLFVFSYNSDFLITLIITQCSHYLLQTRTMDETDRSVWLVWHPFLSVFHTDLLQPSPNLITSMNQPITMSLWPSKQRLVFPEMKPPNMAASFMSDQECITSLPGHLYTIKHPVRGACQMDYRILKMLIYIYTFPKFLTYCLIKAWHSVLLPIFNTQEF